MLRMLHFDPVTLQLTPKVVDSIRVMITSVCLVFSCIMSCFWVLLFVNPLLSDIVNMGLKLLYMESSQSVRCFMNLQRQLFSKLGSRLFTYSSDSQSCSDLGPDLFTVSKLFKGEVDWQTNAFDFSRTKLRVKVILEWIWFNSIS